ncbi:MAG: hypothetical protein KY432_11010 [Acidobacteria bacterium]|nr:hypothetical protein [Acidobacteriota bacterium]
MRIRITLTALILISALAAAAERKRPTVRPPSPVPTFSADVAHVFARHCHGCHRPEGAGPFSLIDYETAYAYRYMIRHMTETRQMPPWRASLECGDWKDPAVLSPGEIALIGRWVDSGAPEGNPALAPPSSEWDGGWQLGTPDSILQHDDSFEVDSSEDSWRCFVYEVDDELSRYLAGIEILNEARREVHHMIAYLDTSGVAARLDMLDPAEGYDYMEHGLGFVPSGVVGLYTPGERPFLLPEGIAIEIPPGAHIVLQVHYHPHHGEDSRDRPRIGLHHAKGTVRQLLGFMAIFNGDLFVPANEKDVLVEARQWVDEPISIRTMGGHMHFLGQGISVRALRPDGTEECLLRIDDWDQRWQGMYHYRQPVPVPAGSELLVQGWYDNTSDNPENPHDPPRDVYWGEAAVDEMLQGYLTFTRDLEYLEIDP